MCIYKSFGYIFWCHKDDDYLLLEAATLLLSADMYLGVLLVGVAVGSNVCTGSEGKFL